MQDLLDKKTTVQDMDMNATKNETTTLTGIQLFGKILQSLPMILLGANTTNKSQKISKADGIVMSVMSF